MRFFVTGLPRSGTTWMSNMLNEIPGVECLGQGKLFASCAGEHASLYSEIEQGIRSWARYIALRKHNVLRTDDAIKTVQQVNVLSRDVVAAEAERYTEIAMKAIVDHMLTPSGGVAVGEKQPVLLVPHFDRIMRSRPNDPVFCLVRDVEDWIVSWARYSYMRRVHRAPETDLFPFDDLDFVHLDRVFHSKGHAHFLRPGRLAHLARMWRLLERRMSAAASERSNVMLIRYEDLHASPADVLGSVLSRLGVGGDHVAAAVEACDEKKIGAQSIYDGFINGAEPGTNRRLLTPEDIQIIRQVVGGKAEVA